MMKVRLQQPSGTELASFNPILPPASITQVVLLANPLKVWLSELLFLKCFNGLKHLGHGWVSIYLLCTFWSIALGKKDLICRLGNGNTQQDVTNTEVTSLRLSRFPTMHSNMAVGSKNNRCVSADEKSKIFLSLIQDMF